MGTYITRYLDLDDWMTPNDEDLWDDDSYGRYEAFVPDRLSGAQRLSDEAMTIAARAEAELAVLDDRVSPEVGMGPIEWLLLRTESISSTHIEGIECSVEDLMLYEETGVTRNGRTAAAGVARASLLLWKELKEISEGSPITVDSLSSINDAFLIGTPSAGMGGSLRETQNWVGTAGSTPADAAFVPPPPDEVGPLMDDLVGFCNDARLPSVAVAAMAHAQFETIHPYVDGNGRTGRALVQMVLRSRGVMKNTVLPVSTVLSADRERYIQAMSGFQEEGPVDPSVFVTYLSDACIRAARASIVFQKRLAAISETWRQNVRSRSGSVADALIRILPYRPVITVGDLCRESGVSERNAREGIRKLVESGILAPQRAGRQTAYIARSVIDAMKVYDQRVRRSAPVRGRKS